jgi:outer membrane protein TolC
VDPERSRKAVQRSETVITNQYKVGALSYLNVIMAQSTALMTETKSIQITLELSWLRSLLRSLFLHH